MSISVSVYILLQSFFMHEFDMSDEFDVLHKFQMLRYGSLELHEIGQEHVVIISEV